MNPKPPPALRTLEQERPPVPAPPPTRARRWPAFVALLGWVLGAVVVATSLLLRTPGPPGTPRDLRAHARLCLPPKCEVWTPTVTLAWSAPPDGGDVTRYVVFRDGEEVGKAGSDTTTYVDDDEVLDAGDEPTYRIRADGDEGSSPQTSELTASIPVPGLAHARIEGVYDVRLTITAAGLFQRVFGVESPAAGDTGQSSWLMVPRCLPLEGACDVEWEERSPSLHHVGKTYRGEPISETAECGDQQFVKSRNHITLHVTDAEIGGQVLEATAFEGTITVALSCFGSTTRASASFVATVT